MHFKHPEILYALILLLIPILVHLFQLQKFVKIPFTNVKLLKQIQQQTRKSARLKKWLILTSRILALFFLIIAFAQPYFSNSTANLNENTIIYLDNSFSMQAKNERGEMLKTAAHDLIETFKNSTSKITLITNNKTIENSDFSILKNELSSINYSPNNTSLYSVLLEINSIIKDTINTSNKIILISDFQDNNISNKNLFTNVNGRYSFIKTVPSKILNISIDTVYIKQDNSLENNLQIVLKSNINTTKKVGITLHNKNLLMGKASANFSNSKEEIISFKFLKSSNFKGKITIADEGLQYDNFSFFTISKPEKINVLTIGENSNYLKKLYNSNEFNYLQTAVENTNFNSLLDQHFIILNEIENLPKAVETTIIEYLSKGGNVVLIPSKMLNTDSYQTLFSFLKLGPIKKVDVEQKITSINYNHRILNGVFEKQAENFQYPTTKFHFEVNESAFSPILKFNSNRLFIGSKTVESGNFYWISSPLNQTISDFTRSPLIVPIFYNLAKNSLKLEKLYQPIGKQSDIEVAVQLKKDEVLSLSNANSKFIPLQQIMHQKVLIDVSEQELEQGFYDINTGNKTISTLAFNYDRKESELKYMNLDTLFLNRNNVSIGSSIKDFNSNFGDQNKMNSYFKWLLAFSILFLLLEILILKYFK